MTRKLIIFGNGLGMAIDPTHFSLTNALNEIWNKDHFLNEEQRNLMGRALGHETAPQGEHELDALQQAIAHCKALARIGEANVHWLTEIGQAFPDITAKYVHKVATKLHNYDGELPPKFEGSLVNFVKETKSHVATLNYDKLLYSAFIDSDVFTGYDGHLVDGMVDRGFSSDRLERKYGRTFGYYLHLHGSPLFVTQGDQIIKLARDELTIDRDVASEHVVLTHVKHKPSIIIGSRALTTYWHYLHFALSEAKEIILFGYSGLDWHLNVLLRPYLIQTNLRIVEWNGAGAPAERDQFWTHTLGRRFPLIQLDNITDFVDW